MTLLLLLCTMLALAGLGVAVCPTPIIESFFWKNS